MIHFNGDVKVENKRPSVAKSIFLGLVVSFVILYMLDILAGFLPIPKNNTNTLSEAFNLFERGKGNLSDFYVTSDEFINYSSPQKFSYKKKEGVYRVFLLGGSAALGWPNVEECSALGYLKKALEKRYPGRYEIINAAVMSFGSARLSRVLDEIIDLEPDLVIFWAGNNEYVEDNSLSELGHDSDRLAIDRILVKSNLVRLVRVSYSRITSENKNVKLKNDLTNIGSTPEVIRGDVGRNPQIDERIYNNFISNYQRMILKLNKKSIQILFCTVPVNLSGWAPDALPPLLDSVEAYDKWNGLMQEGVNLLDKGDDENAKVYFEKVIKLTPDYGLAYYFEGLALQRQGRLEEAYSFLSLARDKDLRVVRALSRFNDFFRSIRREHPGTKFLDLEKIFKETSGQRLVGMDLFYDYCHPNPIGHMLISASLLPIILDLSGVNEDAMKILQETNPICSDNVRNAVVEYALGMTFQNNGQYELAMNHYRQAIAIDPDFSAPYTNLGNILFKQNRLREAEEISLQAINISSSNNVALNQLGGIAFLEKRFDDAESFFRKSIALSPFQGNSFMFLGQTLEAKGVFAEAEAAYRKAAELGIETYQLHAGLGNALFALNRKKEAITEWEKAIQYTPNDPDLKKKINAAMASE